MKYYLNTPLNTPHLYGTAEIGSTHLQCKLCHLLTNKITVQTKDQGRAIKIMKSTKQL